MKILMTNSNDETTLAPKYFKGLERLGINVKGTYYIDSYLRRIAESKTNWILNKVFPSWYYKELNDELLYDVHSFQPEILWIFKGMEIYPKTLRKIKKNGIKIVNYNPDHPFKFVSKGSGNRNVLKSIDLFDLHISYSQQIMSELHDKYKFVTTFHLPFGYPNYIEKLKFEFDEINETCFIGHPDKFRVKTL